MTPTMAKSHHPVDLGLQQLPAFLVSHNPQIVLQSGGSASSPHLPQRAVVRVRNLLRGGAYRDRRLAGAVVSVISLVVVLALLAVCRTVQKKLEFGAAPGRNLSDADDDQERSNILEECLDFEEEHGLGKASHKTVEDANKGTERLVAMMYESAADFERKRALTSAGLQGEELLRPAKVARLNEPSSSTYHPLMSVEVFESDISGVALDQPVDPLDADAWETTYPEFGFDEGKQQQHLPKPTGVSWFKQGAPPFPVSWPSTYEAKASASHSASVSIGNERSADALVPDSWLHDFVGSKAAHSSRRRAAGTVWPSPAVEATLAAPTTAGSMRASDEHGGGIVKTPRTKARRKRAKLSTQVNAVEQHGRLQEASDMTSGGIGRSVSDEDGLAAARVPCIRGDIRLHPFVRLPAVNPKHIRRSFRERFALLPRLGKSIPIMESYTTMRSLFAKELLTAIDVEILMTEAEILANYATSKLSATPKRRTAHYLVVKLSAMVLAFDYLVCTIQLLGDKMNTAKWWPQFVQKFRTEYSLREKGIMEKTEFLNKIVNRLSRALRIYKKGERPPPREVIELKRTILTRGYKGSVLSHRLWKLWLQDDAEFCRCTNDSGSASEFQATGHGQRQAKPP